MNHQAHESNPYNQFQFFRYHLNKLQTYKSSFQAWKCVSFGCALLAAVLLFSKWHEVSTDLRLLSRIGQILERHPPMTTTTNGSMSQLEPQGDPPASVVEFPPDGNGTSREDRPPGSDRDPLLSHMQISLGRELTGNQVLKHEIEIFSNEFRSAKSTLGLSSMLVLVYIISWTLMTLAVNDTRISNDVSVRNILLLSIFGAIDLAASVGFVMVRLFMFNVKSNASGSSGDEQQNQLGADSSNILGPTGGLREDMHAKLSSDQLTAFTALRLISMRSCSAYIDIYVSVLVTLLTILRLYAVVRAIAYYRFLRTFNDWNRNYHHQQQLSALVLAGVGQIGPQAGGTATETKQRPVLEQHNFSLSPSYRPSSAAQQQQQVGPSREPYHHHHNLLSTISEATQRQQSAARQHAALSSSSQLNLLETGAQLSHQLGQTGAGAATASRPSFTLLSASQLDKLSRKLLANATGSLMGLHQGHTGGLGSSSRATRRKELGGTLPGGGVWAGHAHHSSSATTGGKYKLVESRHAASRHQPAARSCDEETTLMIGGGGAPTARTNHHEGDSGEGASLRVNKIFERLTSGGSQESAGGATSSSGLATDSDDAVTASPSDARLRQQQQQLLLAAAAATASRRHHSRTMEKPRGHQHRGSREHRGTGRHQSRLRGSLASLRQSEEFNVKPSPPDGSPANVVAATAAAQRDLLLEKYYYT